MLKNHFKLLLAISALALGSNVFAQQTVIGIASIGPHPALSATIDGFKQELAKEGFEEGKNTKYVYGDASFTMTMLPQVLSQIEAARPALILTLTSPVTQAALRSVKNKHIPMVFSTVSQPVRDGIVPSWEHGSDRFTGVSGVNDKEATLAFAMKIFPNAKKFGVIYNPGDSNDIVSIEELEAASKKLGLVMKKVGQESPTEAQQRAQTLTDVDFFYALASNNIQSAIPAIASVMDRYNVPILSEESELIKKGMVAVAYGMSYETVGASAGKLAIQILKDGKKTSELAPSNPPPSEYTTHISRKRFAQLGKRIPDSFQDCDCFVD